MAPFLVMLSSHDHSVVLAFDSSCKQDIHHHHLRVDLAFFSAEYAN